MHVRFTFNRVNVTQSMADGLKANIQFVSKLVHSPAPSGIGVKAITANGTYYSASEGLEGYNIVDVNVSGGGGSTLIEKTVSANGVYNASSDNADGYSKVTVSVPASAVDTGTKSISTNGTHDVIGYASANVAVPASAVDTGTKSITANGTGIDVIGYAAVDVAVPNSYAAADEGKVVSNGALVAQTAHAEVTQNGTIDTTLNNSVTVNVSGASMPRLLNYVELTMSSTATQADPVTVNLTPASTNYMILVMIDTIPSPDATYYIALTWNKCKIDTTATPSTSPSAILRPAGTIGTDQNMVSFNETTGVLSLGGQYGYFLAGTKYHIYQFTYGS